MRDQKIGFIGSGNMTRAILGGLVAQQLPPSSLAISDPDATQRQQTLPELPLWRTDDNLALVKRSDILILAVKPQLLHQVLTPLASAIQARGALVISIVAGINAKQLQNWLGGYSRVIRTMPNTPSQVGQGMSAILATEYLSEADLCYAEQIFSAIGQSCRIENEVQMDAVTAISGSGPAYFFLFMEALEAAALALGIPEETARALVLQTALGSAQLATSASSSPAELRKQVTSKGGTTEQALLSFEKANFREIILQAAQAAAERAKEMAKQFGETA